MRSDGTAAFYLIQHKSGDKWVETALNDVLFTNLTYDERRGEIGDRYREIIKPQQATSDLWQKFGIHGFAELEDARAALTACREHVPDYEFRSALRTITQKTEVIE